MHGDYNHSTTLLSSESPNELLRAVALVVLLRCLFSFEDA